MKILTLNGTTIEQTVVESITLSNGTEIGAITVGEKGRGRRLGVLPLNAQAGEVVTDVVIGTTKAGKPRLFKDSNTRDNGLLLVFKPKHGFRGSVDFKVPENAKIITDGHIAQGIAGRMGGNNQYILKFENIEGVHFEFKRRGRLYGEPSEYTVTYLNSSITCLPTNEYELI